MIPAYMFMDGKYIADTRVQVTPQGDNYLVVWLDFNHVTMEEQLASRIVSRSHYEQVRKYLDEELEHERAWAQSVDRKRQEHLEYLRTH